jgi:polar amino acid transport system substrate-binding protein
MAIKSVSRCSFALLLWLTHGCALAASAPVIGFDNGSPPFFDAKGGKATGIYPLLVEAIFDDADMPMVAASAPFTQVLANMDNATWGGGGLLKTPARLRKYDYTDYIFVESVVAYYSKRKPLIVARFADLRGQRVGVLRGWSYGESFDASYNELGISLAPAGSDEANFHKLQLGRLDVVFALEEVGSHLMATGNYPDVEKSSFFVRQNPSYIAFNKAAGRRDLVKKLNKSIARMRESGQLGTLVKAYLATSQAANQTAASPKPHAP